MNGSNGNALLIDMHEQLMVCVFMQCGWWHEIESWCEADDEFAVCVGYNWPEMDQCILGPGLIQLKHHTAYPILTQGEVATASHECAMPEYCKTNSCR